MIKQTFLAGVLALSALPAVAEGYQVNTLSARQNGMGHTGTALKLGAESMIFNPAGLAFNPKTIEFQVSITGIFATAKAKHEGMTYETNNDPSTPMAFNLGMKVYDNFAAGISFYTPYGSSIKWGDNWPGAMLNQSVDLKVFTIQPTLAWRFADNFSLGAGVMISWGNVDLNKGLVSTSSMNAMLQMMGNDYRFSDTPASVNLKGRASTVVGFNIGAMWDINSKVTVGASFRSKMNMKVKCGDAAVRYANEVAQNLLQSRLDLIDRANFKAQMPAVAVLNIGVAYRPADRWLFAFDAQLNFWKAYDKLEIEFLSEQLKDYNQCLVKNYHNAATFRFGAQYSLTERFDLRAGLMVDCTPVNQNHYNPETPGMTKIEPSIGFSFEPLKNFAIDASLLYVAGLNADNRSCTYDDLLAGAQRTFKADYSVHSWCPSVGCRVMF